MSGLAAPDASLPEKIASFALPLAAGAAAAVHPAGARGLAGLTSAVQNQLAVREYGRREKQDQDLTMSLSQLLGKDTGVEAPTGEIAYEGTPARPGSPEEAAGQGALMPVTRRQTVADQLGQGPAELVRALLKGGRGPEAATLLAGQLAPKDQWHQIVDWDPVTKQNVTRWINLKNTPSGSIIGRGKPVTPLGEQIRQANEAVYGQPPQSQPATAQPDIPSPPAGEPPPPPPIESAPLAQQAPPPQAPGPTASQFRARPTYSIRAKEGEEPTVTIGQGTVTTHLQKGMRNGREWLFSIQTDQSGQQSTPVPVMEAPSGEGLQAIQRQVMGLLPNLQPGSPQFDAAVNEFSLINGDETAVALGRELLQQKYGLGSAPPAPRPPGPQPGVTQQGASSPTPQGVRAVPPTAPPTGAPAPAPAPLGPMTPTQQQAEAARRKTQQEANRTAAVTGARTQTEYNVKQGQQVGPEAAGELQYPGGGAVPPTTLWRDAAANGARKVLPTPPNEMKVFNDLLLSRAKLDEMARLIPQVDLGNIVGSIRTWANEVAQTHKVGPIPIPAELAPKLTPEQNQFLTLAADYADAVVRIRTGAALPDKEYVRLLGFLLSPAIEPGAFQARLGLQQRILQGTHETWEKILDQGGYRVPRVPVPSIAPREASEPGVPPKPVFQQKGYSVGAPTRP